MAVVSVRRRDPNNRANFQQVSGQLKSASSGYVELTFTFTAEAGWEYFLHVQNNINTCTAVTYYADDIRVYYTGTVTETLCTDNNSYRYGFNGKEKIEEISGSGNWYSFEFREYDPRTGRFNSIDPLTKQYPWQSPYAFAANNPIMFVDIMGLGPGDPPTSTEEDANNRIGELSKNLQQSEHFKNVTPEEFINQITERIHNPSGLNQGQGTNFCWAAACMSYVYEKNPVGMVEAMFSLYTTGTFNYANGGDGFSFTPVDYINDAAGSSTFDNNPGLAGNKVDQMLFMTLAAKFKGYMNVDGKYSPGDEENPSWSGGNLAKAKEMWNAFGYDVKVSGTDVAGWYNWNKGGTVQQTLKSHDVVLFVNNPVFKGELNQYLATTGSHYIRVNQISSSPGMYKLNYWDYGKWKPKFISHSQFFYATFGMISIPR